MSKFLALILMWLVIAPVVQGNELPVSLSQIDAAIEKTLTTTDSADPDHETFLKSYRDTRELLLGIEQQQVKLNEYSAARVNAYDQAQQIRAELEKSQGMSIAAFDESMPLAELEQRIQVDKSDLLVLQGRLTEIDERKASETGRPGAIRERLAELGALGPELGSSLKLLDKPVEQGSMDEARLWMAKAQNASNRAEKERLDAELLSQPMRMDYLSAQQEKLNHDIAMLEKHLQDMQQQASELRQEEAKKVLAATETAQAESLGKHVLVQDLADQNTVFGARLGERSTAIEGLHERELESRNLAERFERDLSTIERKLDILGMTKTMGEILREQSVRLPSSKRTTRQLTAIAELIGDSSLRQMELQDEMRSLQDIQSYIDGKLLGIDAAVAESIRADLLGLAQNRKELVDQAIDVEATYARVLTDLDNAVNRSADAVEQYRLFISERLLWVQSSDPLSWTLFTDLPPQLREAFAPDRWLQVVQWLLQDMSSRLLSVFLLLLFAALYLLTPRLKARLVATGRFVGSVRNDSFVETLKALAYTVVLVLKWPLLVLVISMSLEYHEADSGLTAALHFALTRIGTYLFALECLRCLLLPKGVVESHFRWPGLRVVKLYRRVVRFEQIFLGSAFLVALFLQLYPTDVGGAAGTIAMVALLLSMAYFFYRPLHFVQDKMNHIFSEREPRLHSFWGRSVHTFFAGAPLAMIVAVCFGYIYTTIEFSLLLLQTVMCLAIMLVIHEVGMRWLHLTRRRLKLKVQESQDGSAVEGEQSPEEDLLEHDPELLDDEGTKFLNALLILGSLLGIAVVWSEVVPALGILDSVGLWQYTDSVDGGGLTVQVTLADLIVAFVIGLLGWVMLRRLPNLFEILLRQKMEVAAASAYTIATVSKYVLTTVLVLIVISMLGVNWGQIQWAVAALSLGIGFGLQEIVANFFSGLIILIEQPIRVGDTVTVGDKSGVVTKIQMRATTIRDWDRRELLVPNKEFVTGQLLNWSLTDPVTRLQIELGVIYGTDIERAMNIVRQAAVSHPLTLSDPAPFVTFENFGVNSLVIVLRCYLEDLNKRLSTASAIRLAISHRLKEAGITVAVPQRDVHLDARSPLDIRLVSSADELSKNAETLPTPTSADEVSGSTEEVSTGMGEEPPSAY